MKLYDYNWMQLEEYLRTDDRVVVPLGSVEQHAYLSLGADAIGAEHLAIEATKDSPIPVLPVMPFGLTPRFVEFAGTITIRQSIYLEVLRDMLDGLWSHGFKRFLLISGHVGNSPARDLGATWESEHPGSRVLYHGGIAEPEIWAHARSIDPDAGHASWVENIPSTRLAGVAQPAEPKPAVDPEALAAADPVGVKELLGDGSFGGAYEMPDEEVLRIWEVGVAHVRGLLDDGWSGG